MASSPLWLFDLDNTLHDASHAIFPAIHANMNRYIAQTLREAGLPHDDAAVEAARQGYWRRYGATLLGMVVHHRVKVADFLAEAHRFDDLAAMIRAERGLAALLDRLPGRKILLTNAPLRYSKEVVRRLGLHRRFARHIAIESMRVHGRLRPKPSPLLLRRLLARERMAPHRCILVEDTLATLKAAKRLGLRTVWMTRFLEAGNRARRQRPVGVDLRIRSARDLPAAVRSGRLPGRRAA